MAAVKVFVPLNSRENVRPEDTEKCDQTTWVNPLPLNAEAPRDVWPHLAEREGLMHPWASMS